MPEPYRPSGEQAVIEAPGNEPGHSFSGNWGITPH